MRVQQNMQVHTTLSNCARREMELPSILDRAVAHDLRLLGLSDHVNNAEQWDIPGKVRAGMPEVPAGLQVLVGCEAQMLAPNTPSITEGVADNCDVVLIACNHYHLRGVETPRDRTPAGWAMHHLAMIEGAIDTGFCDIIPHPFLLAKVADQIDVNAVLEAYPWSEVERILRKAGRARTAFELNPNQVDQARSFMESIVRVGQEVGCLFSIGSDAHTLDGVGYERYPGGIGAAGDLLHSLGLGEQSLWQPSVRQGRR